MGARMTRPLIDAPARGRALTELDATLLVEAAAGTGKTAIIAGRVAMLLAGGRDPASIAAVTFTELAAGELALRIRRMVEGLLRGETPEVLRAALPDGLRPAQREALAEAVLRLDELTATTIHGFCQGLIRAYAVEADIDPGATVMDAAQEKSLFERVFSRWLTRRLSDDADENHPVAVLAEDDPLKAVEILRELARLRREHPRARAPEVDTSLRPDIDFVEAARDFARWAAAAPAEPQTAAVLAQLDALAAFFQGRLSAATPYGELLRLSRPDRQPLMKRHELGWRAYSCLGAWRKVAGDAAERLNDEAAAHYDCCRAAFGHLLSHVGARLVAGLSRTLDEVIGDYAAEKRAAAALDFDDLVVRALRLVRDHEPVRAALHQRYRHILVDEFQDTDPVQAAVIFNIAAEARPDDWRLASVRAGGLFLVGDPKQAIYRFRGAHVAAYAAVRQAFIAREPGSVVQLQTNFRSRPEILQHVNACFQPVLAKPGQPGYVALSSTLEPHAAGPCAVRISIDSASSADAQRDEEAAAVADVCRRLIGAVQVRREGGSLSPLNPGDIALLAPTKRDLWRYERALEEQRLSVASQAGEALMRRQETQDILALLRTLADPFDTLAFGALMRGPLVGLTEAQLLAIAGGLPPDHPGGGPPPTFSVVTPADQVEEPIAREMLVVLQDLRRRAAAATPKALLSEAIERLNIRVALALRTGDRSARALANLDALVEMARPYAVRGLSAFVADLQADWEAKERRSEGRSDESEDAVSIVTMHSSKGLEWPVVIPINTATRLYTPDRFIHRQSDDTLHWVVGGVMPPELEAAQAEEALGAGFERERLWYVACTRARDLLLLPHMPDLEGVTWSGVVDLGQSRLPELDLDSLRPVSPRPRSLAVNNQSREVFEEEGARIAVAVPSFTWRRPSDHDPDRAMLVETADPTEPGIEVAASAGGGRVRGVLLHKLMEELITGEIAEGEAEVAARAAELRAQLVGLEALSDTDLPDPLECATTVVRTLHLPEVAALRPHLVAELPVYGRRSEGVYVAGRMDAAAVIEGRVTVVIDWKSDVAPGPDEQAGYAGQLADYLVLAGAERGALVYMSRAEVIWITPRA